MSSPTQSSKSRITNPRRILVLTPSAQSRDTVPPFLHALTGVGVQETRSATDSNPRTSRGPPSGDVSITAEETETGSTLKDDDGGAVQASFAGYTTHSPLRLDTKYYTADVPIWVDEVPLSSTDSSSSSSYSPAAGAATSTEQHSTDTPSPSAWTSEFLSVEAREVRDAIAAIVLCIQPPEPVGRAVPSSDAAAQQGKRDVDTQAGRLKEFVGAVAAVKERIDEERGGMGDVAALLVLVRRSGDTGNLNRGEENGSKTALEGQDEFGPVWWDEELCDMGVFDFEVVSWCPGRQQDEQRRNEFGELEGIARVREILEASEWTSPEDGDEDGLQGLLGETFDDSGGFDLEASELEKEMLDLRLAIEKGGDEHAADDGSHDDDLNDDQMETLMSRVQAIRDMGSDMPESERRQFAAKAIRDIMKDI